MQFDLTVSLAERRSATGAPQGLDGWLIYRTDLFTAAEMDLLAERFALVTRQLAANPRIAEVELLTERERQLLRQWSGAATLVPRATFPELFSEQAAKTPQAAAVIGEEAALRYAELDAASSRLARLLISRGAGPEKVGRAAARPVTGADHGHPGRAGVRCRLHAGRS